MDAADPIGRNRAIRRRKLIMMDFLFCFAIIANSFHIYMDWDYWKEADQPLNLFILIQMTLLILIVRVPICFRSNTPALCCIVSFIFIGLIANTILGTMWLINFKRPDE
jgi:hypothetical protein